MHAKKTETMNNKILSTITVLVFFTISAMITTPAHCQKMKIKELGSESDWNKAITEANAAGKDIFLDIYATWCGPCKMMEKNVYTNDSVASFYNSNFINLKIDGETDFGTVLASKFQLTAYPSLYFLNQQGELINTVVGYRDAEAFILSGKTVKDYGKVYMQLSKAYNEKTLSDARTEEFMELLLKFENKELLAQLASNRIKSFNETDVLIPSNKMVVMAVVSRIDSFPANIVLSKPGEIIAAWGETDYYEYLSQSFDVSMRQAAENKDANLMEKIINDFVPVYFMRTAQKIPEAQLTTRKIYYSETADWISYINSVEKYFQENAKSDINFLYQESYYIVENQLFNPVLLNKANEWLIKVIAIKPDFDSFFLAAVINTYREDKDASISWMQKAEGVANTEDQKTSLEELKKYLDSL